MDQQAMPSIGIVDVYRVVTELQQTMAQIRTHLERVDTRNEYSDKQSADFEARIRVIEATSPGSHAPDIEKMTGRIDQLERFRYTLAGGLALLAFVCSGLGVWIASVIHP